MPTSEQYLLQRLRDTEQALRRQLEAIDRVAEGSGVPTHQLMTPDGGYVAAPVLVALANVQIALLAQPSVGTCGVADCVDHALEDGRRLASQRDDLIAQGVDPADLDVPLAPVSTDHLCMANSGERRGAWWCSLPKAHDGAHRAYVGHDTTNTLCCEWGNDA